MVINEVMYHPPGDLDQLQFIELFNADPDEADLSEWRFSKGIKFRFPAGTKLAARGFLVVCRDRAAFTRHYGAKIGIAGEFQGHLSHNGERLELSDSRESVIDAFTYSDSAPWPLAADGHSSSLERISPSSPADDASNWAASNLPDVETPGGTPGRVNDSFSPYEPPIIGTVTVTPSVPVPGQPVTVETQVSDTEGVTTITLFYRVINAGRLSNETAVQMERSSGDEHSGHYRATLPAQPESRLVRYRIEASDKTAAKRSSPAANDLRGAWTYSTFVNTNTAQIPLGFLWHPGAASAGSQQRYYGDRRPERSRGSDVFVYMPPGSKEVLTFDFVQAPPRKGGYKVHFLKDQTLRGMTGINIIFEGSSRFVLAEALAYEVYRRAEVPTEFTEHIRFSVDNSERGYHLLIEQPNKSFLQQRGRDTSGNLYKLIWYGSGIVGQHEKKTNITGGHDDLLEMINGLTKTTGAAQWAFIQKHFNVDEFASYFAVNMCIQNWDGFHNNYFLYHDSGGKKRWEIYPWDEDKTWGDYDGASQRFDWYEMPLTFGMNGSVRPLSLGGSSPRGGYVAWWRDPGAVAGPLLANAQFRQQFLTRLRQICTTAFTPEAMLPVIDGMEKRLEAEIPLRARLSGEDPRQAAARFRDHIQSFRNQLINRRKFILSELEKTNR